MRGMGSSESKNNKSRSEAALIAGLLLPGSAKWLRGRDLNPRPLGYELKDLTDRLLPSLIYIDIHLHLHGSEAPFCVVLMRISGRARESLL